MNLCLEFMQQYVNIFTIIVDKNKIIENDLLVIYSYKNLQVYTINKRSIKYYLFLERNFNKIEKKDTK